MRENQIIHILKNDKCLSSPVRVINLLYEISVENDDLNKYLYYLLKLRKLPKCNEKIKF